MLWPQARPFKLHCASFHIGILVGTVKILDKPGKILGHETCDGLVPLIHRGVNTFCHFLLWKVGWALFRWTTQLHCWLSIYAFTGFHTMLPKSSDTGAGYISLWQWIKIGINLWYTPKFDPLKVKFMHSDILISIYYWKYYCNFKGLYGVTDY